MIPVYKPAIGTKEKKYVNECLDEGWISSRGKFIEQFEQSFSAFTGVNYSTSVCNGTVALHLALIGLGIGVEDEIIVPTFTYIASINSIMQVGAKPVYVDSLHDTWQMDPSAIASKISAKTKAIMVVHLYGYPCDMDAITKIANQHGLLIIEDCAESFGTYYKKQHTGTFGDIATFSFFGNKTITTGEGGMVCCKSADVYKNICKLKNQGVSKDREYWHDTLAYNYRMTNICAAIGLAQLESAAEIIKNKRIIALAYSQAFKDIPVVFHAESDDVVHSFWMCSIAVESESIRNELRSFLKAAEIETRPGFVPAHLLPHTMTQETFPVAEKLSATVINLPSWPDMSNIDMNRIISTIKKFFATYNKDNMLSTEHADGSYIR